MKKDEADDKPKGNRVENKREESGCGSWPGTVGTAMLLEMTRSFYSWLRDRFRILARVST